METLATFIDRLQHAVALREGELGVRILKKDLAQAAGVTSSAVTQWFQGTTEDLKAASLLGLSNYLKVRVEWLRDGAGPMRSKSGGMAEPSSAAHERSTLIGLSQEAQELVNMIVDADHAKRITKDALEALTRICSQLIDARQPLSITDRRAIERAEALVASHQPKHRKGKGAA